ncbi:divergent polysaccharide deacetylase family protein [Fuchsiella alkaliacetigena]|uniref:divergent polysaccharide deacetylase family protein n=1 Tax=Fuchsiella alkaliacetigena TaxID=957042 RepID=UPI00200B5E3F|nr:divergent polysaccharide deacetylase family protein [Fuchsiella alkaliacetigena]MCK8824086.1 divergent polysaccharide deacetylase family protein [Fuchsiella alkaliacetigena]
MNLNKKQLIVLASLIGMVVLLSGVYLLLTRLEVEEEVVTSEDYIYYPQQDPPRLDYTKFSQQLEQRITAFWFEQDWELKAEETVQEPRQELKADKKLLWEHTQQQVELPFPVDSAWELDNLLKELEENLAKIGVQMELKQRSTEAGQERALLEIGIYSEYIDGPIFVYRLELIQPEVKAEMAFIIDDFGFNWLALDEILNIDRPITAAVLPFLPGTVEQAQQVKEVGYEIMLHMPMEAISDVDPGPGAIYVDMSAEEIEEQLRKSIENLEVEVVGVNNHMGSKATADKEVMEVVLDYLWEQGLYFIDSSTAPKSVVPQIASENNGPYGLNYLFIDNVDEKEAIKKQIDKLSKVALDRGKLITIGHVRTDTALAIQEMIPVLEERGIRLAYVSELVN